MNLRLYIICIAAVLALVVPAVADNSTATVHGAVYGWDTFEPLENAVVDVNSTPAQSMVAKNGLYFFELEPGNYSIKARYYQNNTTTYSATETITIKGVGGSYVLDLLLLPVYSKELMDGSEVKVSAKNSTSSAVNPITGAAKDKTNTTNSANITEQSGFYSSKVNYLLIALTVFLLLAASYSLSRKHKKIEKKEPHEEKRRYITGDSSGLRNIPERSVKAQDKSIDPEVRQDFQVNTEETVSVTEVIGSESRIPLKEQVTEPEAKLPVTEPEIESESKIPTAGQVIELESRISEKKAPVKSKEEYLEQEIEFAESGSEEENHNNSLEESVDNPKIETPISKKKLPLSADLLEVMDIIRGQGGRITQKDLRSRLKYSEGKVSLMLADLERRELIEKFKRGRGNVVILRDEER